MGLPALPGDESGAARAERWRAGHVRWNGRGAERRLRRCLPRPRLCMTSDPADLCVDGLWITRRREERGSRGGAEARRGGAGGCVPPARVATMVAGEVSGSVFAASRLRAMIAAPVAGSRRCGVLDGRWMLWSDPRDPCSAFAAALPRRRNLRRNLGVARNAPSPRTCFGGYCAAKLRTYVYAEPWMPEQVRHDGSGCAVLPRRREASHLVAASRREAWLIESSLRVDAVGEPRLLCRGGGGLAGHPAGAGRLPNVSHRPDAR